MSIRTLPTPLLQIFYKIIVNSSVIFKSVINPDDICWRNSLSISGLDKLHLVQNVIIYMLFTRSRLNHSWARKLQVKESTVGKVSEREKCHGKSTALSLNSYWVAPIDHRSGSLIAFQTGCSRDEASKWTIHFNAINCPEMLPGDWGGHWYRLIVHGSHRLVCRRVNTFASWRQELPSPLLNIYHSDLRLPSYTIQPHKA